MSESTMADKHPGLRLKINKFPEGVERVVYYEPGGCYENLVCRLRTLWLYSMSMTFVMVVSSTPSISPLTRNSHD